MRLHVVLDASRSMGQRLPDGRARGEALRDQVRAVLDKLDPGTAVSVHRFGDNLIPLVDEVPPAAAALAVEQAPINDQGGSRVWDALYAVAEKLRGGEPELLFCVTDGEDLGSRRKLDDVKAVVAAQPEATLRVVVIGGAAASLPQDPASPVRCVQDPAAACAALDEALVTSARPRLGPVAASFAVIPLVDTPPDEVAAVQEALRDVVPYLETRTGLRYYPVPTLLVDHDTLVKTRPTSGGDLAAPEHDDLYRACIEMIRFLEAAAVSVHVEALVPAAFDAAQHKPNADLPRFPLAPYAARLGLSDEEFTTFRWHCECFSHLRRELSSNPAGFKPGLQDLEADARTLLALLRLLHREGSVARFHPDYFVAKFWPVETEPPRQFAVLERLGRFLSAGQFKKLEKAVRRHNDSALWPLDLGRAIKVLEVIIPTLWPMIREYRAVCPRLDAGGASEGAIRHLVRELANYGFYARPGSPVCERRAAMLRDRGFPAWFSLTGTGLVVLCLEDIRNLCREWCAKNPAEDYRNLLRRLLSTVLVHEHGHAITTEGLGSAPAVDHARSDKYRAVAESLSNWFELDYFRADPLLSAIVHDHSGSGPFPAWPYAGALYLESGLAALGTGFYPRVRRFVATFRTDLDKAHKQLLGFCPRMRPPTSPWRKAT